MPSKKFIIFGASGDLAKKRLYPALFELFIKDIKFDEYVGYGRSRFNQKQFGELAKNALAQKGCVGQEDFLARFKYFSGGYDKEGIKNLKSELAPEDKIIFYLSIPTSYELVNDILTGLDVNNLINKKTQIVLEKPFGSDFVSANKLNRLLLQYFNERQIYRIDHYLAKDLVRDLLTLRFGNSIFEPLWNNKYIEGIAIKIEEAVCIENRGEFYDQTGAVRDILQNHALQLLALTAMDQPKELSAELIRQEKQKIFKKLRLFKKRGIENIKIGQYCGYCDKEHIKKDSLTETFAELTAEINSPRWKGVPITLLTGKKLKEQSTDIIVKFRFPQSHPWKKQTDCLQNNELCFNIQPKNHIELKLNFGFDAQKKCATPINLKFGFQDNRFMFKDAYENALNDLQKEDQSIFLSSEEILLSWKFIDPIINLMDKNRTKLLKIY
ncbi:hypothetical protein KJ853_00085 [Patescibacteria group bacterium]|nr:hypothetical protein [Patescibacteria group bacterium]